MLLHILSAQSLWSVFPWKIEIDVDIQYLLYIQGKESVGARLFYIIQSIQCVGVDIQYLLYT